MTTAPTAEEFLSMQDAEEDDSDYVDVVLTRPPGPDSDFVELEDPQGRGLGASSGAEWVDRGDGFAVLRIPVSASPLDSIAHSLRTIAASMGGESLTAELVTGADEEAAWRAEYDDLYEKYNALFGLLADIEKIVKPSTSKVSLEVKAAIDAWKNPEVPQALTADEVASRCHTQVPTGPTSPDICKECSANIQDYVEWPCPPVQAAQKPVLNDLRPEGSAQPAHDAGVEEWRAYARNLGAVPEGTVLDQMNRSQIRTMLGIEQPA